MVENESEWLIRTYFLYFLPKNKLCCCLLCTLLSFFDWLDQWSKILKLVYLEPNLVKFKKSYILRENEIKYCDFLWFHWLFLGECSKGQGFTVCVPSFSTVRSILWCPLKTGDEIPKININLPDPSKPSDIFWVKAAQHTLPVGFAKSVQKVECFNDMIEILYVGEESEEMVLPCKISFTKGRFVFWLHAFLYGQTTT